MNEYKRIISTLTIAGLLASGLLLLLWARPVAVRADPGDLFVTPDGSGDCSQVAPCDLQTALRTGREGDIIYLAQGTYTGSGDAVVTLTRSITFCGGWDGVPGGPVVRDPQVYPTILDGEGERRVVTISGHISPTVEGLIITGGEATGLGGREEVGYVLDAGGGMYSHGASPIIVNNVITSNVASRSTWGCGGGLYLYDGNGAVVRGNTIISNTATLSPTDGFGGGVYLDYSDAIVIDNTIVDNIASPEGLARGGGLFLYYSDATVTGNTVISNTATRTSSGDGGGLFLEESNAIISGNVVAGNVGSIDGWGQGGGLFISRSAATVSANAIQGNAGSVTGYGCGGGIRLGFSPALIDGNTVVNNNAISSIGIGSGGGIYIWASRSFTLTNNVIAHNRAGGEGGGISVRAYLAAYPSHGVLVNNTIAENKLGDAGEGVWIGQFSAITLTNNIIVSHAVGITNTIPASATVAADHTLFYGNGTNYGSGVGSTTEISGSDPLFENPAEWDYHLQPGSPAIDAGTTISWVIADIDGDRRPIGVGYDIGADEFGWSIYLPVVLRGRQ
ncbi:MAG: NosD domain-containing protein [Anaerolineae bacterium]